MSTEGTNQTTRQTAGAFDIRSIIAMLLGVYGLVLVGMGLFDDTEEQMQKTDGININLWAGLALIVAAGAFAAWVRLRPIVVEEPADDADEKKA